MNSTPKPEPPPIVSRRLTGCGYIVAAIVVVFAGLTLIGDIRRSTTPATPTPSVALELASQPTEGPSRAQQTPTAMPVTPTSAPTSAPTIVTTAEPTTAPAMVQTANAASDKGPSTGPGAVVKTTTIPGLAPADVTVNLEQRGFDCASAEPTSSGDYFVWRCKRADPVLGYESMVEVWGRTLQSVDYIDAAVFNLQGDDTAAKFVLGFIATMPYDGAMPAAARQWVENTMPTISGIGDVKVADFGGVAFQLYGPATARNLEIGTIAE